MKKLSLFLALFSFGIALSVNGQQDVYTRLFYYNPGMYNPAATGLESKNFLTTGFNTWWTKRDDHPFRFNLAYERTIDKINSSAAVYYFNSSVGFSSTNTLGISYSYKFKFSDVHFLKIGIQLNVIRYLIDFSGLDSGDPALQYEHRSAIKPDMNLGIWYSWKNLNIGSSFVNIFRPTFIPFEADDKDDGLKLRSFVTFLAKYQINLSKSFALTPAIYYFAYSNFNLNGYEDYTDYGLNLGFRKIVNLGLVYSPNRVSQWTIFAGGKIVQKINIQFSYGIPSNNKMDIGPYFEALVSYSIN